MNLLFTYIPVYYYCDRITLFPSNFSYFYSKWHDTYEEKTFLLILKANICYFQNHFSGLTLAELVD